jgi:two-component system, cell cycle response regulator DivK
MTTVLIVEDDERNRKLARDVLDAAGFRTFVAATGAEGITLAREQAPDVILLDLRLPDIGGAEAARALKDDARTTRIPVVAMSALSLEGNMEWLEGAGFAGAIEKPISVQRFPDDVRRFCADPPA